jgi:hypothetical protein
MKEQAIAWLETKAQQELAGCRRTAVDGTILFTPDGQGNYGALWTRDFAYMVQNAYHLLDPEEVRTAILYLLHGQRADGCIPDRRQVDGRVVYSAGPAGAPLGEPPTDNAQFMVDLVHSYVQHSSDTSGRPSGQSLEFVRQHLAALHRALDWVPRCPSGLVFIPPGQRQSPYGFTDTVAKSGELCFSSLLYWNACQQMVKLCALCGETGVAYVERAAQIEGGLQSLWDAEAGAFRAATGDCRQVDVWASAFAVFIGFARGEQRERLLRFLRTHYDHIVWHGQVRHLLRGEQWERTLIPVAPGTYQNGAYWATASGWVWDALCQVEESLADRMLDDLLQDFQGSGICECINVGYRKLAHYVVSAINPLGALRRRGGQIAPSSEEASQ